MNAMKLLRWSFILVCLSRMTMAIDRVYYIAAIEEDWDYLGWSGMNTITGQNITRDSKEGAFFYNTDTLIGSTYTKALYREYTDDTFTTRVPRPVWLGFLGPVLRAETGDRIVIYFKNLASFPFTMHPHGVLYEKDSEGARYSDGTSGANIADNAVLPSETHTYIWSVEANRTTPPDDNPEDCRTWPYHSHYVSYRDENAGLFGFIITCKQGTLDGHTDFVLFQGYIEEQTSMYLDENTAKYTPNLTPEQRVSTAFRKGNNLWNINGLSYGNLPGLEMCVGDRVRWFATTFGKITSLHTIQFNGNPLTLSGKRRSVIPLVPGYSTEADMYAVNPGTWLISSGAASDGANGATALYTVRDCGNTVPSTTTNGKIRHYYIAIEEVDWNYAPLQYPNGNETGAPVFRKALYRGYTDDTFLTPMTRPYHMGFIGPVIKAEVGDTVMVTLVNKAANRTFNIHPTGMMYDKANEGELYQDGTGDEYKLDDGVAPGQNYTYTWTLPNYYGPEDGDSDCITSMYYSSYSVEFDKNSGLIGPMILCKKGSLDVNDNQIGFDEVFVLMFIFLNEKDTWYWQFNEGSTDELLSLNGYFHGNMKGLDTCACDRVQWHIATVANEEFFLGAYFEGHVFTFAGQRQDTVKMEPGEAFAIEMIMKNTGTWLLYSEIDRNSPGKHVTVNYTVTDCGGCEDIPASGVTREYFIAAEEMLWDYNPLLYNFVSEENVTDNPDSYGYILMARTNTTIGNQYYKIQYVEYTDDSFTTKKTRRSEDEHLGYHGPIIRAEVYDTIKITFKNTMEPDLNMAVHGIYEQTTYINGRSYTGGAPVKTNETGIFTWVIAPESGPADGQPNCIVWPYQSDVNLKKDPNSGLIGALIVCRQGILDSAGTRTDVDREFVVIFRSQDENLSWLLDKNIQAFCLTPDAVDKDDESFAQSNDLFTVNGRIFGYPFGATMYVGERVAWQVLTIGRGGDVHPVHFHGHTVLEQFDRTETLDVILSIPGTFSSVQMIPVTPGIWLLHCHANEHLEEGMFTTYEVLPALPSTSSAAATVYRYFVAYVYFIAIAAATALHCVY